MIVAIESSESRIEYKSEYKDKIGNDNFFVAERNENNCNLTCAIKSNHCIY
jgi:hypothetical protein